jgi:Zn finger protein HypA/HybF involved in hydrogenase expression
MSYPGFVIETPIEMETQRCYDCGRYWALEKGRRGQCPVCGHKRSDALSEETLRLGRVINALRAAITRAKRGRR